MTAATAADFAGLAELAGRLDGGAVNLSVGDPCDAPPADVVDALASSGRERGYPPSIGTVPFREAAAAWMRRRLEVDVPASSIAACVGTKELVVGLPHLLHHRDPGRDTVLYPAVSYPSYAMGATLAGCRAVPVPLDRSWRLDLDAVDPADAERALCLWVDSPGNPCGGVEDLGRVAAWGRARSIPVLSDECYVEFSWVGTPRGTVGLPASTILDHGSDGVLAVHSLSKRSNLAGLRVGFYAGDADLVAYLSDVRRHQGMMVSGPVQAAAVVAWGDDAHVVAQRDRYRARLDRLRALLEPLAGPIDLPEGAFYLWLAAPDGDAFALAEVLARRAGVIVSPGSLYGAGGSRYLRVAAVQPDARLDLVAERLS